MRQSALPAFLILLTFTALTAPTWSAASPSSLTKQGERQEQALRCSPQKLSRGDTLSVEILAPHGGYLAIVNPAGKYFFLTSDTPEQSRSDTEAGAHPIINTTDFSQMRSLQLVTTEAKAVDWSKHWKRGRGRAERIFNRTGWYKVLVSHMNFERDDPSYDAMCRVRYINGPRMK